MKLWNSFSPEHAITHTHTHTHTHTTWIHAQPIFKVIFSCVLQVDNHLLKLISFFIPKVTHQGICISIHWQICSTKAQSKFQDHRRIRVMKTCRGSEMKGADETACKGDIRGCFYPVCRLMRREKQRERERERALSSIFFLFKHSEPPIQSFSNTQNRPPPPCTSKGPILHSPKEVSCCIFSPSLH